MGVMLQVARVNINLLICKLMLLGLKLEELFAVHESRSSSGADENSPWRSPMISF